MFNFKIYDHFKNGRQVKSILLIVSLSNILYYTSFSMIYLN